MSEEKKRKSVAYDIAISALFVAVIAVCAWIAVPISEISITLQTMGVCLAAAMLGWERGLAAVAAYILLGLVGVPVFSGFTGGAAKLIGPTGGYIVGFLFTALLVGIACDLVRGKAKWLFAVVCVLSMIVGIAVCYAFGTGWFMFMMSGKGNPYTLSAALAMCVLPYIPFDLIKIAVATALSVALKRFVK